MISILIPSNRETIERSVNHILQMAKDILYCPDYEIIISSKKNININNKRVKVIKDTDGNVGSIDPVNKCFAQSQGDYFIVTCDDVLVNPNIFYISSFIESERLSNRKYKICSIGYSPGFKPIPEPMVKRKVVDKCVHCGSLHPARAAVLSFPAGSRDTVYGLLDGVIFNKMFSHIYADNWLSWYLHQQGEPPVYMHGTHMVCDFKLDTREESSVSVRSGDEIKFKELMNYYDDNPDINYNFQMQVSQ